ncbi:MAG: MATE family efflux transporter, partial [Eubacterium sp.]|nr:MATE family efflux transporter [Eubacterium sp.]
MKLKLSDHFTYKSLIRFVLPTIFMMIVTSIYSIVDGFFVSNFVGKNAFAAVNLIMPVLLGIGAFGFMIGTGGSALVAKTLGEGDHKKANRYFSMLTYVIIIFSLVVSIICFIFMPQISRALGASDLIFDDCVLYGRILISVECFFMLQNSFQSFLVTAGKSGFGLGISISAGLCNIILDFLLVYVFDFGIAGAAAATAFSQIVGGIIPVIYFARKNDSLLRLVKTKIELKALGKACLNGLSEMLTNLSNSIVSILYNLQLIKLAAEDGISAYGVVMYISFIFMAFFFGYAIGVNPIIGYNYGAQNNTELKNVLKKSLVVTSIVSVAMITIAITLSNPISNIFVGYDAQLHDITSNALKIYSFSFLLCGFNIFSSAFFTGLNNGVVSAIISFTRTLIFQVTAVMILPIFLGINGIWLAITAAESATLILTIIFFIT